MASISAVELDGTDLSYLNDDSLVVECNTLNVDESVVSSDNLDVDETVVGSNNLNDDDSAVDSDNLNGNDSVGESQNSGEDVVSTPDTLNFIDLQSIINETPTDLTLELHNDFINEDGSVIVINKNLTIDGNGHTIDLNQHAGFKSLRGNVYLKNLIMKNGNSVFASTIFISKDASYIIDNCSFINNSADFGAAINSVSRNTLFIRNSIFDSNSVSNSGGAIYSYGNLFLENSLFLSNKAMKSGGAIYAHKEVNIDNCTFRDNSASND